MGTIQRFETETMIAAPLDRVWDFFSAAQNLEYLTPEFLNFKITSPIADVHQGQLIDYQLRVHGIPLRWRTLIEVWEPKARFVDLQLKGPYRLWRHTHRFESRGNQTWMHDLVEYQLPLGILGHLVAGNFVRKDIESIFDYRGKKISEWSALNANPGK